MKVIVRHPQNPDDIRILQKKTAALHAEAVLRFISKLPCSKAEKLKLLNAIIETVQNDPTPSPKSAIMRE